MHRLLLIGVGGFFGSILRYVTGELVHRVLGQSYFPYGTLAVNIIGCFLIGVLGGFSESRQIFNPEARVLVFVGFLGSYTTFATFGYDVFNLAREGDMLSFSINLLYHFILGIGSVWLGFSISELI